MAQLLTGKEVAASLNADSKQRAAVLAEHGVQPTLAFVRVGARPDDLSYERSACKRAEAVGLATRSFELAEDASQDEVLAVLSQVNADASIHGCLLFRPLPRGLDEARVCDALAPEKDIDGITTMSLAALFTGRRAGFAPGTAAACVALLDHYGISVAGKHVVIVGRSLVVGKPLSQLLLARHAGVTVCHSRSENLPELTRSADIVVCATGRARAFGAGFFAPGQTVLDVGINFDEQGKLCGDVAFDEVEPVVAALTPVPGGLGAVTTAITLQHVVQAAEAAL